MKRRILTVILLLGAALPLLYSAGSVCLSVRHNRSLQARFTRAEQAYPYQEAVEKGELDLNAVSAYFRFALAPIKYHIQNEIRTPSAISYYADMEDDAPVFTIEKGEIVSFLPDNKTGYSFTFRGSDSLPANRAGWRLAKPFVIVGRETPDALLYVKLDDLMSAAVRWLRENPGMERNLTSAAMDELLRDIPGGKGLLQNTAAKQLLRPTKRDACSRILLFSDRVLSDKGVYLSGDLKRPLLSPAATICLIVSALLLITAWMIGRAGPGHRTPGEGAEERKAG